MRDQIWGRYVSKCAMGAVCASLLLELLCQDSGGPCFYTGRPLKQAHGGLGVTEADWSAFTKHLTATLDFLKIAAPAKGEVLAVVGRYQSDVVEKP